MNCGSVPVDLSASRKSSKKIRMIYIEEEEFTIEGDFMSQEVMIHRKPGQYQFEAERYVQENIIEKVMVNKLSRSRCELSTFIDCVENGPVRSRSPRNRRSATSRSCEKITGIVRVSESAMTLESLIRKRGPIKKIGVIGMGYVGIPARSSLPIPRFRTGLRVPAGLALVGLQDRDAEPGREPAQGRGAGA